MKCKVKGCERKVRATGLCRTHYRFSLDGKSLDTPIARKYESRVPDIECNIPGCSRWANGTGWCTTCSARWRRQGGPQGPLLVKHTCIDSQGYVRWNISHPENSFGRQIKEHQAVMSKHLGRELYPGENVHHKNGDRQDNRLSNLELWNVSQPPGQRVEDKVQWAREILALYGELSS